MAGLVIGIQYLTTLLSRPLTSSLCDRLGSKLSVICGLLACALSGLLTLVAPLQNHAATGLALLLVGRVLLGVAPGFISTGSPRWGIARAGPERAAQVLSWHGVAQRLRHAVSAQRCATLIGH